uniref:Uncharacterized protein n=1 Tax=Graphocephala atropunctata TaxID=36148 RepID=A0A1B6KT91_9HEMI
MMSENETPDAVDDSNNATDSGSDDWCSGDELDPDDEALIKNASEKVFCFETDHAALRGNKDYHNLLKTLVCLEAQKMKAIEDVKTLRQLLLTVKEKPQDFLEKIISGDMSDFPSRIDIVQVPKIDWSKYHKDSNNEDTRAGSGEERPQTQIKSEDKSSDENSNFNPMVFREKKFCQSKSVRFNQPWSPSEQIRLEELLLRYPPERKESIRWRKIAHALGNRTAKQVCSRVQKYFKRLNKAGLPFPGHQLKTGRSFPLKRKFRRFKKNNTRKSMFSSTHYSGGSEHQAVGGEGQLARSVSPSGRTEEGHCQEGS